MSYTICAGTFYPLGATVYAHGVNFAVYSKTAESVELLLFTQPQDSVPQEIIPLKNRTRFVWHCFVEGIKPGQLYGYIVKGPYEPEKGLRFNPNRLLIDPYTKALSGKHNPNVYHFGYETNSPTGDLSFNPVPNYAGVPKSVVIDDTFAWDDDTSPGIPTEEMIVYEVHIKGFTAHPSAKVSHSGTYLGVIEKIPYLKNLGITSIEFLPVQHCYEEDFLIHKGLTNYWGYNTIGFFAPDWGYSTNQYAGCQVSEFKEMVKSLHRAGIEIILDVVYNHTGEGNEKGPTLCFRGIDNPTYYKLAANRRYYMDYTGCGNTLNFDDPQVIKLVMDSLRYWVETMHVDGFRFDLASVLGREEGKFEQVSNFFIAIHQDPILSRVKLIAEPWDIAWDSYQVGNFPVDWAEWNGKYRDCIRKFVKGDPGLISEFAYRVTGSSDLYADDGRTPYHSINFLTCHDGFTLNDVVSYERKHNEANLENNRDGNNDNYSWNWGVEGDTDNPEIFNFRKKQIKNFFTILLVSQGVPMILGGDEFLRTQQGNNNTYCQDNELNYFNWDYTELNIDLVNFVSQLIKFRKTHPHLQKKLFFTGQDINRDNVKDINWYDETLNLPDWCDKERRSIAFLIQGEELENISSPRNDDIMVILNLYWEGKTFKLPSDTPDKLWYKVLDTSLPAGQEFSQNPNPIENQNSYLIPSRSVTVLLRK